MLKSAKGGLKAFPMGGRALGFMILGRLTMHQSNCYFCHSPRMRALQPTSANKPAFTIMKAFNRLLYCLS